MITISKGMASLLVAAIRDAMKYNTDWVERTEVGDVTELEEYLVQLGNLEGEVREQYTRLQNDDARMLPYERIWNSR